MTPKNIKDYVSIILKLYKRQEYNTREGSKRTLSVWYPIHGSMGPYKDEGMLTGKTSTSIDHLAIVPTEADASIHHLNTTSPGRTDITTGSERMEIFVKKLPITPVSIKVAPIYEFEKEERAMPLSFKYDIDF